MYCEFTFHLLLFLAINLPLPPSHCPSPCGKDQDAQGVRCWPCQQVRQEALSGLAWAAERGPISRGNALKLCLDLGCRGQAKLHWAAVPG